MAPPTPETPITANESLEIFDFVIKQGHGVKGLSELGLKRIPDQYIQPLERRIVSGCNPKPNIESIPIIDMSNWDDQKVAASICDAAQNMGFFQIVNHGVPMQVLENVKNATRRFFRLPAEEKRKYSKGYTPSNNVMYTSSFIPEKEQYLEWKDTISIFYVSDKEAQMLWPSECRDEVLEYMKSCEVVAQKLLGVLMKGLSVNMDDSKASLLMGSRRVNLNYYPKCPNPDLTVGVGSHSDISTLTILLQDEIGGLHVRSPKPDDASWLHVTPITNSLVINVGDALQILSNGRYKSVEHSVIASKSCDRVSVPFFVNPKPSDHLYPLPEILANGEEPLYKKVLYSDYAKHFLKKPHDGKMTLEFAKI